MPVNIIDTLKPKNGGNFPIVEAIDVFVEGFDNLADAVSHFATDVMIEAINTVLSGKANTSDVNTAVANLQGQIDQIVISASAEAVVAPEVAQARVDETGKTYETLGSRLNAKDQILDMFMHDDYIVVENNSNDWAVGSTNDEGQYEDITNRRITTPQEQIAESNLTVTIDSGYRYSVRSKINNLWTSSGWQTGQTIIPKDTIYKIVMGEIGEETIATVRTFLPKIHLSEINQIYINEDNIDEINDYLSNFQETDKKTDAGFVKGSLNTTTGEIQVSVSRIAMSQRLQFERTVEISHDFTNFQLDYIIYDAASSSYLPSSGWLSKTVTIPANTPFQIMVRNVADAEYRIISPMKSDPIYTGLEFVYPDEIVTKSYLETRLGDTDESPKEYSIPAYVKGLDNDLCDFKMSSTTKAEDIYAYYDGLMNTFPNFITRETIGTSTTPTGTWAETDSSTYPIYCYTIKCNPSADKKIILAGGIHGAGPSGDPIEGVVACAYYIRDLLFNQQRNKYMKYIYNNCIIKLIPLINPWGIQNNSRGNGNGVDVNRNFDINWVAGDSYDGLTNGAYAFSESESQTMRDFFTANTDALFLAEIHSRMNETILNDTRWLTICEDSEVQSLIVDSCKHMISLYGGARQNTFQTSEQASANCRAYAGLVKGIKAYTPEFFRSNNLDLNSLDGLWVELQAVNWFAVQIQLLVEHFCM